MAFSIGHEQCLPDADFRELNMSRSWTFSGSPPFAVLTLNRLDRRGHGTCWRTVEFSPLRQRLRSPRVGEEITVRWSKKTQTSASVYSLLCEDLRGPFHLGNDSVCCIYYGSSS